MEGSSRQGYSLKACSLATCRYFHICDAQLRLLMRQKPLFRLVAASLAVLQVLDSALTRPGRLSRKVVVPLPDRQGREDILNVHLRPKPMISAAEKAEAAQVISRLTGDLLWL